MVLKETKPEFSWTVNKTFNAAEGTIQFIESYMQTLEGGVCFPALCLSSICGVSELDLKM